MNPNKYLRKAVIEAIATATGKPTYDTLVPVGEDPQPSEYILVNSVSKSKFADDKGKHDWACSVQIDIVSIQERGFAASSVVDDIEEDVIQVMDNITVAGLKIHYSKILDTRPMNMGLLTQEIIRTVILYDIWVSNTAPILTT